MSVYVLDNDGSIAEALRGLLDSVGLPYTIFDDVAVFLNRVDADESGCLLLDVRLPKMSGLQVQSELKRRRSNLSVIFLTNCTDVAIAVEALKSGASEYITRPFSEQKLLDSIFSAVKASEQLTKKRSEVQIIEALMNNLTKREREILDCIATGMINKVISAELFISSKTVEMHRANIMKKMQAKNLAELIKMYTLYELSRSEPARA